MWGHAALAAPTALAIFMATYAIDCLMNAMVNPIYMVALGAIAALAVAKNPMPKRNSFKGNTAVRLGAQQRWGRAPALPARPAIQRSHVVSDGPQR
jgi:hypothetical protein